MHDCTFLKCGVQQTIICFKPLAHRSVKLTFSGRLSLTEICGELPVCICMYTQYSDSVNFQVMTITQRDQH